MTAEVPNRPLWSFHARRTRVISNGKTDLVFCIFAFIHTLHFMYLRKGIAYPCICHILFSPLRAGKTEFGRVQNLCSPMHMATLPTHPHSWVVKCHTNIYSSRFLWIYIQHTYMSAQIREHTSHVHTYMCIYVHVHKCVPWPAWFMVSHEFQTFHLF